MGKIKKILENELVGGTQTTDVYPVTSIKAVYDESNERLDNIIRRKGVVNISTNYNSDHIAEVLTLSQALGKVPVTDRVLGFQGKYLASDGWHTIIYTGESVANWGVQSLWIDLPDKIFNNISKNATFAGVATPTTNPGTPDGPVSYFAVSEGTYSNFGNLYNAKHELSVFSWNNDSWSKESLATGSDITIIDALPAIYATAPSQNIGADGDYVLVLFTISINRIYKKVNGGWLIFMDYDRVLVCAGNRVFYRKNNDQTILFTEITAPIIDAEVLDEGIPSQSANEGDYALTLNINSTNEKRLYIYNNAKWMPAYSYSHFISPIFRNGNDCYKIYPGTDNEIGNVTKIINNSAVDALQKETGDLQKELHYSTILEKLAVTASGAISGTGASDKKFYLNVTPLTTYTLRFKAQYTGALALYASTDGTDIMGIFFEVKDTDFTSEYVATITTPDNCNVIRTRTYLNTIIDYISLYSVQPLNVVVKDIEEKQKAIQVDWLGKVISTYGDSVTALNGGDFNYPYDESTFGYKWALRVANYFNASSVKNRGIGGQRFSWLNNGGSVSWVNTLTGEYVNRNESYNYDNYEGNVEIPSDCTPIRGALSSWLRITSMYPESIKDTIDVILVMAHNDIGLDTTTKLQFLTGDNTDPEWANSAYYQTYNGDYNINTVRGGIASTIMKLQAWMPNAVIVLMTPISGRGTQGELNPELTSNMTEIADIVKEMHNLMSIPCIDVYGTCGINGLNRTLYITDTIHPYSENGSKMVARAVIGGLKSIIPNM